MANVERWQGTRWRARWRDPDGRTQSRVFDRKHDAEQHLVNVQHDIGTGAYVAARKGKTPLRDYYAGWSVRQPWRANSRRLFDSVWRNHIAPAFGLRPMAAITRGGIEDWARGLPLAPQTARDCVAKLSTLLEAAAADGYIPRNPAKGARRPTADVSQAVAFTQGELEALREAAPDWFKVSVTLGAACGLRQGEATGLTADRVNFLRRELVVDRQLDPRGGAGFTKPKNQRSYRTVPLADVALEDLSRHMKAFGSAGGFVLHSGGRPISRARFGELWRSLRRRAGLPAARFHDTRHTFASTLLSGGVSVPAAAAIMGHSPATLLRTYAHLIDGDEERIRSVIQHAFGESSRVISVSQG